jgi:hypothetical protein
MPSIADMLKAGWTIGADPENVPVDWRRFRDAIRATPPRDGHGEISSFELELFTDFVLEALREGGRKGKAEAASTFRDHIYLGCKETRCEWRVSGSDLLAGLERKHKRSVEVPTVGMFLIRDLSCPTSSSHELSVLWVAGEERERDPAWNQFQAGTSVRVTPNEFEMFWRAVIKTLKQSGLSEEQALQAFDRQIEFQCRRCHQVESGDDVATGLGLLGAAGGITIGPATAAQLAEAIEANRCRSCASRKLREWFTGDLLPDRLRSLAPSDGAAFDARWTR